MKIQLKNAVNWLLPLCLILFILEVIAFPFTVGLTFAGRSEGPDHTLTYRTGELLWNHDTDIDENGAAELSLFDAEYENVAAEDGTAVIAPGTEGYHIIRLHNTAETAVTFTAVLYTVKSNENLPVAISLQDGNFADSQAYMLPEGVGEAQMIRSVAGSVQAGQIVDFDIAWLWSYEISDQQDMIDVDFGNKAANGVADDVTVGFYLVVEDKGTVIPPKTADSMDMSLYLTLMGISGGVFVLLLVLRKREQRI